MPQPGAPPADQVWVIHGDELMAALRRAHLGTDPELVYLEMVANSVVEKPKP